MLVLYIGAGNDIIQRKRPRVSKRQVPLEKKHSGSIGLLDTVGHWTYWRLGFRNIPTLCRYPAVSDVILPIRKHEEPLSENQLRQNDVVTRRLDRIGMVQTEYT